MARGAMDAAATAVSRGPRQEPVRNAAPATASNTIEYANLFCIVSAPQKCGRRRDGLAGFRPATAACSPFTLWVWIHVETKHHVVILVSEVVTVGHIRSGERPEVAVEHHFFIGFERDDVLARVVVRVIRI